MAFASFTISDLDAEHEDDYQIEITSGGNLHGFQVKEDELRMLGESFLDTLEQDPTAVDNRHVSDFVEGDD